MMNRLTNMSLPIGYLVCGAYLVFEMFSYTPDICTVHLHIYGSCLSCNTCTSSPLISYTHILHPIRPFA